jgi:UDP-2,3-diacylglucosamine pyrophosphatase LpxH
MLVIASDLHLVDGTCAKTISPSAFYLFVDRLRESAYQASWRKDNIYRPIDRIDLVLMGDILDPLHSTRWLNTQPGDANYVRPWSNPQDPAFAPKLLEVTRAIIQANAEGLGVLKNIATPGALTIPRATKDGHPNFKSRSPAPIAVNIYYTVGNHDWYYHLPGAEFDAIRQEIIDTLGLSNPVNNFPYEIEENEALEEVSARYKVFLRHGDYYDKFNFDKDKGRNAGTLGDALAMEVINRYPVEVQKQIGAELPSGIDTSLRRIANIRPLMVAPVWIESQIKLNAGSPALENELKAIWDRLCDEFLELDFVRHADHAFKFDTVDALRLAIKISDRTSFSTISGLVDWLREKTGAEDISYAAHAMNEPAIQKNQARFVVYGHTHFHEIVPLNVYGNLSDPESQIYINSGTWHSYIAITAKDRARLHEPEEFVPYQAMTYLAFYAGDERGGRSFEAWSGTFA